jgi:cytoskeletal protein RodZ
VEILKNNFKGSSRSNYRAKRKKTNLVLNGLIGIVILLIAVVSFSIFSGNDKTSAKKDVQTAAEKTQSGKQSAPKIKEDTKASTEKTSTKNSSNNDSVKKNQESDTARSSTQDNQTNSDQLQTVDSPDSSTTTTAPAGSSGQHVTSYDSSSQDWQEMLQTMSSATGIDQGNMTVWFLGSDRSTPGGSVGTISAKDNKGQKYKVYLQWDGQGYKATRVEPAQ